MRERSLGRYAEAVGDRLAVVSRAFGLPAPIPGGSIEQILESLLDQPGVDVETRAWAGLLVATGRYPTESQTDSLRSLLGLSRPDDAWGEIRRAMLNASKRSLSRRLVLSAPLVVDVTRTSRAMETSGIPRVARGVAAIASVAGGQLVVWADGVPGHVTMLPTGLTEYPTGTWRFGDQRRRMLAWLKRKYWTWLGRLSRVPGGGLVVRATRSLLVPLANALFSGGGPEEALLLVRCRYVLPEVPLSDTVTRLIPCIEAARAAHCASESASAPWDPMHVAIAVHDLLPVTAPQFFAKDQRVEHIEFCRLVSRSDSVVVASPHMVDQVRNIAEVFSPGTSLPVRQVPYGIDAMEWTTARQPLRTQPEFIMIGSMEPRKNHRLALLALGDLARSGLPTTLHVVGGRRPVSGQTLHALRFARAQGVEVVEHISAPDSTLRGLMENCVASLYLSWAEGFGLPVLESLALGLPVIASDIPSNREHTALGGVALVDPHRPDEVSALVSRLIRDIDFAHSLREGIRAGAIPHGFGAWSAALMGSGAAPGGLPR